MKSSTVYEGYDIGFAICYHLDIKYEDLECLRMCDISDAEVLVRTANHGSFLCESWNVECTDIFTQVTTFNTDTYWIA